MIKGTPDDRGSFFLTGVIKNMTLMKEREQI